MSWAKEYIYINNSEKVEAIAPIIVSASRSTDIPAFYSEWFFSRLRYGYSAWTNPFNGVKSYVSYKNTRFIVFWSKNPKPLIPHLATLKEYGISCYIQFTLNDYVAEGLEKAVPSVESRIETFNILLIIAPLLYKTLTHYNIFFIKIKVFFLIKNTSLKRSVYNSISKYTGAWSLPNTSVYIPAFTILSNQSIS